MASGISVPGVRSFTGDKPPQTIFHSYLGKLEINEEGVYFYSTGGHGLKARILGFLTGGLYLGTMQYFEERATRHLHNLSGEGSMVIPFSEVKECRAIRKMLVLKYLLVITKDGRKIWFWRDFGPFPLDDIVELLRIYGVTVLDGKKDGKAG